MAQDPGLTQPCGTVHPVHPVHIVHDFARTLRSAQCAWWPLRQLFFGSLVAARFFTNAKYIAGIT